MATRDLRELKELQKTGLILYFESLLSESGKETGMLADYAFGVHFFLEHVRFVLCSDIVEFRIEGDRQSPRVYIPVAPEVLQDSKNIIFKCVPIMFNVGINERQELQDIRNKPSPLINAINSFSLNRLYHWIGKETNYLFMPAHFHSEFHCEDPNVLLNGPFQQLVEEISLFETLKKKKNVEIHRIAAEITRSLKGGRIVNCKSGKDRTGMAVTLEQARIIRNDVRQEGLLTDSC